MKTSISLVLHLLTVCANHASINEPNLPGPSKAYFYVAEGSKKCFFENTPASLPVTVSYSSFDNPGVACSLSVTDPKGREVANKEVTRNSSAGRLTYLTESAGQHSVCASCPSSKWFGTAMIKWTLSVDLGDTEINLSVSISADTQPLITIMRTHTSWGPLAQAAAKGHVMESNEQLVKALSERLKYLHAENSYHEEQETSLHRSTELLGSRVVLCALLQMSVVVVSTVLAVQHLTVHFKAEKLVS